MYEREGRHPGSDGVMMEYDFSWTSRMEGAPRGPLFDPSLTHATGCGARARGQQGWCAQISKAQQDDLAVATPSLAVANARPPASLAPAPAYLSTKCPPSTCLWPRVTSCLCPAAPFGAPRAVKLVMRVAPQGRFPVLGRLLSTLSKAITVKAIRLAFDNCFVFCSF